VRGAWLALPEQALVRLEHEHGAQHEDQFRDEIAGHRHEAAFVGHRAGLEIHPGQANADAGQEQRGKRPQELEAAERVRQGHIPAGERHRDGKGRSDESNQRPEPVFRHFFHPCITTSLNLVARTDKRKFTLFSPAAGVQLDLSTM
jgi:hypothetical protein